LITNSNLLEETNFMRRSRDFNPKFFYSSLSPHGSRLPNHLIRPREKLRR
jgi:hypothetical protein